MKKFLLLPLLLFSPLFALPIGNPMDASLYTNGLFCGDCCEDRCCDPCDPCFNWCDAWSFRGGFYGDYVFNRHMRTRKHGDRKIDEFEIFTNAAYLALNICDRLDVFSTLGTTTFDFKANPKILGAAHPARVYLQSENHFSWSVGGRLTIWDCDCFYFGVEGQYFRTKPRINLVEIPAFHLDYTDNTVKSTYSDWQVGIGASYLLQVGCSGIDAVPYVGVKWSGAKAHFHNAIVNDIILYDQKNDKLWGYAVGMTVTFCDALGVTVEGRYGDEKAVHVNGQFRF